MHDSKIAIIDASHQSWLQDCLVISEVDINTIWVFEIDQVKSPMMKRAATVANQAIEQMKSDS
jgi:hypothetical protein